MKKLTSLMLLVSAIACGNKGGDAAKAGPSAETDRYYAAIDATFAGDARTGYDQLMTLAVDSPDTRAGRKARAVLQSDDPVVYLATIGALSAIAVPNYLKFQTKAKESEGKVLARSAYTAQLMYFAEKNKYAKTFKDAGIISEPGGKYIAVMGPKEVVRPLDMDKATADSLLKRAQGALLAGVKPGVTKKGFVIAVIGDIDDDEAVDVWTIDQDNQLTHLVDDLFE